MAIAEFVDPIDSMLKDSKIHSRFTID